MIEGDIYYIESRLKEIDPDYFLMRRGGRVEVCCLGAGASERVLTVPYDVLDARTVELVRKTRVENAERLLDEIERDNRALEKKRLDAAVKNAAIHAERALGGVS